MKQGFRQSMAWLHTWTGLLVGWVLLFIFLAGTAAYYRDEINRWMRPELKPTHVSAEVAAARALAFLEGKAPQAEQWTVNLPDARDPALRLSWRNPESMLPPAEPGQRRGRRGRFGSALLDPATGAEIEARATRGGDFFYRVHFDLHYLPVIWARWIVGFCAMFMLVAIVTGVITHKKIFKDFFTFRPRKGQRSWLDFHNVSAVMALPYHAMITYTGIVTLMFMYLPWGVQAAYPQEREAFFAELAAGAEVREASGQPAAALPIAGLLDTARAHWNGAAASGFTVHHPGDANAVVEVRQDDGQRLSIETPSLYLDAVDGDVLAASGTPGGATRTRDVMYGLHLARFAGWPLRALFFLSGLLGCLMVASGVVLWAVKERQKHAKRGRVGFGLRLVDALNLGTVAGLTIAYPAYFWANRLLPTGLEARAAAEVNLFFGAWALALLAAFAWPKRAMWTWQLWLGGALFLLLPALDAATTDVHLLASLRSGDWVLAGFDLVALALGALLLYLGWRVRRWKPAPSAAERRAHAAAGGTGSAADHRRNGGASAAEPAS